MSYEDLAIGLPGYAAEGETFSVENGKYKLTYDDNVLDSFTLFIANIDAELAFGYEGNEIDLKKQLVKGKSYTFKVKKLSFYEQMKGVDLNVERQWDK